VLVIDGPDRVLLFASTGDVGCRFWYPLGDGSKPGSGRARMQRVRGWAGVLSLVGVKAFQACSAAWVAHSPSLLKKTHWWSGSSSRLHPKQREEHLRQGFWCGHGREMVDLELAVPRYPAVTALASFRFTSLG
jgi:hypothetical protein